MSRLRIPLIAICVIITMLMPAWSPAGAVRPQEGSEATLRVGDRLPDASLSAMKGRTVTLDELLGHVKLISIVPQLNTPVCDEQTHRFSDRAGELGRQVKIVTISTNTSDDQHTFAARAGISNIRFLSDVPGYVFGRESGLLLPQLGILHRAVVVADADNVIRYLELVPMGSLPNFDAALTAAKRLASEGGR
ncbi:2-Cys peroxiredoxin [Nitrospira sp.]|nr:2-Cys peroxiredoxin [Nitrospira sp.]